MRTAIILAAIMLLSAAGLTATIYVPDDYTTIQAAINAAVVGGDTIIVRAGTYEENIDFKGKAITLTSESGPEVTIIDGGKPTHPDFGSVVLFQTSEGQDSVLDGFTLTNGKGTYVSHWGTFTGGGIYCDRSSPTIRNNIITDNSADQGGGIATWFYSSPFIDSNTISYNSVKWDGGISVYYHSNPIISRNMITHNCAQIRFGGIALWENGLLPQALITGNIIMYNSAIQEDGGGIAFWHGSCATIYNNIIAANSAGLRGGGISYASHSSTSIFINNTIIGNWAGDSGGGMCGGTLVANTIVWGNTAPLNPEIRPGGKTIVTYSDVKGGWPGTGNIDADPLCVDPGNDDFHLTWDSPCRGAGDNSSVIELIDFEGDPRIWDGNVDMGADEFHAHMYHIGAFTPGFPIEVKVVGDPGMTPVRLAQGASIQDPPQSTPYGNLYLVLPPAQTFNFGAIPSNGVRVISAKVPTNGQMGEKYFFQALLGPIGNPNSMLTNLMELVWMPCSSAVHVPDEILTIQEAIAYVDNGGVVIVRPGTYFENIDFMGKSITVMSEQGPDVTVIDGGQNGSVVAFQSGEGLDSVLDGFTLCNGSATSGGGITCYNSSPWISNNIIEANATTDNGGGIYCMGSSPSIINNIVTGNSASKNGGGILLENQSNALMASNTIYKNTASSKGGGICVKTSCTVTISNTILWNNDSPEGPEMRIGGAVSPSTVSISHSDVMGGQAGIYVVSGCTLNWGAGMIDADPLFVTGPKGDYYLSQIAAGQTQDSPCVDTCDPASALIDGTTRTDEIQDSGVLDMGYHYPLP